jgi:toxin FitB
MKYLLDTNVISEPMKARPNPGVMKWISAQDEDEVCISVVTITELRYGMERLATGKRRDLLEAWLRTDLARSEALGHPIEARDAFIAATAEVHNLTLVTRNASDFQPTVKSLLSPWT